MSADCLKLTSYFGERQRTEGRFTADALPELGGLLRQPLLTLERVRICKRDGELLCHPSVLHDGQPIHRAIIRRLRAAGLSGATTQRGIWGFHGDHLPHGDRLLQLGRHVPTVSVVIDAPERIEAAFDIIDDLTREGGLVTSEAVPAIRPIGRGRPPAWLFAAGLALRRRVRCGSLRGR